jgi:hypothetical protein
LNEEQRGKLMSKTPADIDSLKEMKMKDSKALLLE